MDLGMNKRVNLIIDITITLLFCGLWVWFAYQYGFKNTPDSWFRGVLGKSIAEGHPYFINLKQGYLYEFAIWHHDATHEPFLPLLYAIFFKFFGNKIIIANIISSLSAGLLIYPLLRLSRELLFSPLPAFVVYAFIVFNEKIKFIYEVKGGLSIPTSLVALVFFLYCLVHILESPYKKRWLTGGVLALFSYYLVRAAPQLIFFWTMLWTLLAGYFFLQRDSFRSLRRLWGVSFLCVSPWIIRKLVIFKNPFFTHMSGMLWKDRSYDYWDYHESMPLPSREVYFESHTVQDFLHRVFVYGPTNLYKRFDYFTEGPFWIYIALFLLSVPVIFFLVKERHKKLVFFTSWVVFIGYCGIYTILDIAHTRHYIPPYFILLFTIASLPFVITQRFLHGWKHITCSAVITLAMAMGVFHLQKDFWEAFSDKYLVYSYNTSDARVERDTVVKYLIENIDKKDAILVPVAHGQRYAFATGLTFIEMPANFKKLNEPVEFIKKYNIRYSLVDVRYILPATSIEHMEMAGNKVLYTIGKGGRREEHFKEFNTTSQADLQNAISSGIKNRVLYIDGYYANAPKDLSVFRKINLKPFVYYKGFAANKEKLFQSGILVMNYSRNKEELKEEEYEIIETFIVNGGRVFLLCPAWVWTGYDKKPLERLPYYRIARNFDLLLTASYARRPYKIVHPFFKVRGFEGVVKGTFSEIVYTNAEPILVGKANKAAAVAASRGDAKIIIYAHNGLLTEKFSKTPEGLKFITKTFEWLLGTSLIDENSAK